MCYIDPMPRTRLVAARPRRTLLVALALVAGAFVSAGPSAAKPYVDTKKRFEVDLPPGWSLRPVPGDTSGMRFKKGEGEKFGVLQVQVRPAEPGETAELSLEAYTRPFRDEIGFKEGVDLPSAVGLLPASSRTFTVFASGDSRTVRSVEVHVMHAFGHVHIVHFEALDKHTGRFRHDVDRVIASYQARAGRDVYGPLVGRWQNEGEGPDLNLDETDRFDLGPLSGTYLADGGRLTLHVKEGKEWYRYLLQGNKLTLKSANLEGELQYKRSGAARFAIEEREKSRAKPLTRDELIGRWKAIDVPGTEPLVLHLAKTGSVSFGALSGSWWYQRGLITIRSTVGRTVTYHVSRAKGGKQLILGGGDLSEEMRLEKDDG